MIEEALRLFQHGRFYRCLDILDGVLALEPDNRQALRLAGTAELLVGRPRLAIGLLRRAARDVSAPVEIFLSLAQAFEALGRRRAADLALRAGLRCHPGSASALEQRARTLVALRRPRAAEVAAHAALTADPKSRVAAEALGCALFQQRRLREAEQVLAQLTELYGTRAPALATLGRVRERLGDEAGAVKAFQRAAFLLPQDARLGLRAATLLIEHGDRRSAKATLRRALAAALGRPGLLQGISRLYMRLNSAEAALKAADAAAAVENPVSAATALLQGQCHLRLGNHALADRYLTAVLRRGLTAPALVARATARIALGQAAEAEADLRLALRIDPDDRATKLHLGRLLLGEQRPHEALPFLQPALDDGASAADALLLGQALYRTGKSVEALAALRVAEHRNPALPGLAIWVSRATAASKPLAATDSPFAFQGDVRTVETRSSFLGSLHEHMVVVNALMHRQVRARFGRHRLGYLMAVLPPMLGLMMMIFIFSVIRQRQPGDMPLALFLMTGLIAWQVFNAAWGAMENASKKSRQVLFVPRVSTFDYRIAALVFEFFTHVLITLVFAVLLRAIDFEVYVDDPLQVLAGAGVLFLMGAGMGYIIEVVATFWKGVLRVVHTVLGRFLFLTSGIFFSVHDLPPEVRQYALLNPLLHVIEYVRNGAESSFPLHGTDIRYPIAVGALMLVFGLALESRFRARLLGK